MSLIPSGPHCATFNLVRSKDVEMVWPPGVPLRNDAGHGASLTHGPCTPKLSLPNIVYYDVSDFSLLCSFDKRY